MSNKLSIRGVWLLTLLLVLTSANLNAQHTDTTHIVQSGDTVYNIANQYDITVTELRQWNELEDDHLEIGMELRIAPPEREDAVIHTVEAGETLFSISRNYGVTIAELQQWNSLQTNVLSVGQEILIYPEAGEQTGETLPDSPAEPRTEATEERRQSTYYIVQSGDFLNRIAREHGMTTEELRRLNDLEGDMLRVGQRLIVREIPRIPGVEEDFEESTPQGRYVTYRVESGESVEDLAERFSMTRRELEALNPETDLDNLVRGHSLTVLLPPTHIRENPYRAGAGRQNLGEMPATRYDEEKRATPTTSGELYNPSQLTAAHPNMSLGSIVYIENPANGRGIFVRINDRHSDDGIKLSNKAWEMLAFAPDQLPRVTIYQEE